MYDGPKTIDELHRAWSCKYCEYEGQCNNPRGPECQYTAKPELIVLLQNKKKKIKNK